MDLLWRVVVAVRRRKGEGGQRLGGVKDRSFAVERGRGKKGMVGGYRVGEEVKGAVVVRWSLVRERGGGGCL